jgi:hypothetical protein
MQKTNQITMKRPMKTITKLALTGLATAIFATGSALAADYEWATFQEGNATVTYRRPVQNQTTVAVSAHGKAIGSANGKAKEGKIRVHRFQTGNGQVSYLAPAE